MRIVLVLFIFGIAFQSTSSVARAEAKGEMVDQIYETSNDYLELTREYWPKAVNGDLLAMMVTYRALNNCWHFRDAISAAKNIDELDWLMQGEHPNNVLFAKGAYFKCKSLVEHYAEFPGWHDFRLRAALAGNVQAKVQMAMEYYFLGRNRRLEDLAYSPAEFLVDAMRARYPPVFGYIAETAESHSMLKDKSPTTVTAWWLLYCKYSNSCGKRESMASLCGFMVPACTKFENLHEKIRHDAGTEETYVAATKLANELYVAVEQQRFDDLGINLVW